MVASSEASRRRFAIVASLALGSLSYTLLQALVVPALPEIRRTTGAGLGAVSWVYTAFLLAAAVGTPLVGRLGDLYGKRRWLLIALGSSAVGSLIAALAPSLPLLIFARAVQGLSGGVFPLAFGIIRDELPDLRVSGAVGLVSATGGVGLAIGVLVAGPIVAALGWHWLFWFQLAIAVPAMLATVLLVPESKRRADGGVDWVAAGLMALGLSALLFGIGDASNVGWASPTTLASLGAGVLVCALWVAVELRSRAPLVDVRLMVDPKIWPMNLAGFLLGAATFTAFAVIPQLAQTSLGGTAGDVTSGGGLALLPCTLTAVAFSAGFGRFSAAISTRRTLLVGAVAVAVTFGVLLAVQVEPAAVYVASGALGIGLGCAYSALGAMVVKAVPIERSGVLSAMNYVLRVAGGAFGAQFAATLVAASSVAGGLTAADFDSAILALGAVALLAVFAATRSHPDPDAQNGSTGAAALLAAPAPPYGDEHAPGRGEVDRRMKDGDEQMSSFSIGTDIGGTFTDCVVIDAEGKVTTGKSPSTPPDFSQGFFNSVADAAGKLGLELPDLLASTHTLVHATTAATNAMVERTGAKVGLLTTAGHGDAILMMRGGGRSKGLEVDDLLYLPGAKKPEPIVPRSLIREVPERIDVKGEVVLEMDDERVREAVAALLEAGAETIAIGFLWSIVNPAHEKRAQRIVEELAPGTFVSCSHEIAPRVGEYYRVVSTVMNAYIGPLMSDYVGEIVTRAADSGYRRPVLFAQSVGGTVAVEEVQRRPLFTLDSGPVSGIVASNFIGTEIGFENIITADMGGTTFDVAVIAGNTPRRRESTILDKYEMYLPMLDVESVGTGGGSIAWVDPASSTIKVGPQSAAADPGPICYGQGGTEPTVTDADVVLGIVNPERFLGGRRRLDRDAARAGIAALGERVGLSVEQVAAGIVEIADQSMAEKIRRMTVYRGHDPREFVVFAFGGASPAHAGSFARELGVKAVVIPIGNIASVLSAMGTVSGDVTHIHDRNTRLVAPFAMEELDDEFLKLEHEARSELRAEGFADEAIALRRAVAMKYGAQVFDIEVPFDADDDSETLVGRFEAMYAERFGSDSGYAPAGIEILRERLVASGTLPRPAFATAELERAPAESIESRPVYWRESGDWVETPIYDRVAAEVAGPAVVELPDTTIAVRPGQRIAADRYGNLIMTFD